MKLKDPVPSSFTEEFYPTLKELTQILHNIFQKIKREGNNSQFI